MCLVSFCHVLDIVFSELFVEIFGVLRWGYLSSGMFMFASVGDEEHWHSGLPEETQIILPHLQGLTWFEIKLSGSPFLAHFRSHAMALGGSQTNLRSLWGCVFTRPLPLWGLWTSLRVCSPVRCQKLSSTQLPPLILKNVHRGNETSKPRLISPGLCHLLQSGSVVLCVSVSSLFWLPSVNHPYILISFPCCLLQGCWSGLSR